MERNKHTGKWQYFCVGNMDKNVTIKDPNRKGKTMLFHTEKEAFEYTYEHTTETDRLRVWQICYDYNPDWEHKLVNFFEPLTDDEKEWFEHDPEKRKKHTNKAAHPKDARLLRPEDM